MLLQLWVQDTKQVVALKEAVELSLLRYQGGRASYLDSYLDVREAAALSPEDALAQTQRNQLSAVVTLYKARGGGWKLSDAEWNEPSQTALIREREYGTVEQSARRRSWSRKSERTVWRS